MQPITHLFHDHQQLRKFEINLIDVLNLHLDFIILIIFLKIRILFSLNIIFYGNNFLLMKEMMAFY